MFMILSPNERLILISLCHSPKFAGDIAEDLNKLDPAIATNLRKMQDAKLIFHKRTGVHKKYAATSFGNSMYKLLSLHDLAFQDLIDEYNKTRDVE